MATTTAEWALTARITEDDVTTYRWRCETCGRGDSDCEYLHLVARWAHDHALDSGHVTIVEALCASAPERSEASS